MPSSQLLFWLIPCFRQVDDHSQSDSTKENIIIKGSLVGEAAQGLDPTIPSYDAAQDIADIDRRLSALQDFLRAAKAPR